MSDYDYPALDPMEFLALVGGLDQEPADDEAEIDDWGFAEAEW